jgi:hypothetical protein
MIVPADKGCATVVINRNDYMEKVRTHLDDRTTYTELDEDKSNDLRKTLNAYLKKLFDSKLFTKNEYFKLFANAAIIPLFYALIKTHKIGNPIRPIVSFIGSPSYKVARFISDLLTPSTNKARQKLRNTYDAKEKLSGLIIPDTHMLVSFDVKALFTSIPQMFALNCIENFIKENLDIFDKTRLNLKELMHLIRICLEASFFKFNDKYYRQIKGTPMGSPASVVIAEIVMQAIEKNIIHDNNVFVFWYRYVDDVISCVPRDEADGVLQRINLINKDIQFTMESEKDSCIDFLDLSVRKINSRLSFSVYRKPTHTDKYLSYDSYHPEKHKISVVRSLYNRAHTLCDPEYIETEKETIYHALKSNGYPKTTIDTVSRRVFNPTENNRPEPPNHHVSAPYIKGTSERVARILKRHKVELCHKPSRTLRGELCALKDKRNPSDQAGVVYKLSCQDCSACYVGETGRSWKERNREHMKDIEKKNVRSNVYHHVRDTGHSFDHEGAKILDREECTKKRKQLESVYTLINHDSINRACDLNEMYHPIIQKHWGE